MSPAWSCRRRECRMTPRYRSAAALMMAVLHLAGCTSWQPAPVAPRQALQVEGGGVVRVTGPDGAPTVIRRAWLQGDTISGEALMGTPRAWREVRVPISDVREVEVRRFSGGRTVALTLLLAAFYSTLRTFSGA